MLKFYDIQVRFTVRAKSEERANDILQDILQRNTQEVDCVESFELGRSRFLSDADDGCPKGDPDCLGNNGDCHDACVSPTN